MNHKESNHIAQAIFLTGGFLALGMAFGQGGLVIAGLVLLLAGWVWTIGSDKKEE